MKKLKLLFPLLGTSALAVTPVLTAQTHQLNKQDSFNQNMLKNKFNTHTDNNSKLFLDGKSVEYYSNIDSSENYYRDASLDFTFTSAGITELVKAKIASSESTSKLIMAFLDKNLKHFDNGYKNSYLNEIEGVSTDSLMGNNTDGYAYNDFMNSMDQPTNQVDNLLVPSLKQGKVLPQVKVRFQYGYHSTSHDAFRVLFFVGKFPPSPQSSIAPSSFVGHFPGMGPYGKVGDQDHAKLISSESQSESLKLDLSTMSINYINNHYLNRPVNSVPLAVMDYLWKAYPNSDWKATLSGFLRAGGVNAVNYIFGKLVDFIGTYQKDGKTLLKNTPAYYYINDGNSFTAAKNQPFS